MGFFSRKQENEPPEPAPGEPQGDAQPIAEHVMGRAMMGLMDAGGDAISMLMTCSLTGDERGLRLAAPAAIADAVAAPDGAVLNAVRDAAIECGIAQPQITVTAF